ncbi:MAG: PrgI family protein [Oscillospiraceae bacterium]
MKKDLYVPANITLENELWKGFTKKELIITVAFAAGGILIMLAAILVFHVEIFVAILGEIILIAAVMGCVQKLENNISIVDYIRISMRYKREQQKYMYKYTEEKNE